MACREGLPRRGQRRRGWCSGSCRSAARGLLAPVFEDYFGVDRVGEFLVPRVTPYLGRRDARRPVRRLPGGARYVRREHQVLGLEEPRARGRGLFVVDV